MGDERTPKKSKPGRGTDPRSATFAALRRAEQHRVTLAFADPRLERDFLAAYATGSIFGHVLTRRR